MSELKTNKISTNDQNNVAIDNALGLKSYTTTQRDALTGMVAGDIIYNSTDSKVQVYSGSAWGDAGGVSTASISYLVIAGGGAGSGCGFQEQGQGGGGAGGYLNSYSTETSGGNQSTLQPIIVFVDGSTTYQVTVGSGGAGVSGNVGSVGGSSQFHSVHAMGGGRGGRYNGSIQTVGGCGGGAPRYVAGNSTERLRYGARMYTGLGAQGFRGGDGNSSGYGGGGGGASEIGGAAGSGSGGNGGDGGDGLSSSITGTAITRAGGGAGNSNATGGAGGGANSGGNAGGQNATANTGGGGSGAGSYTNATRTGGSGGSGIVILRWATADATITVGAGLTDGGVQTDGSDSYIVFTAGTGTITFS